MTKTTSNPMPRVIWDGREYSLKSRKTVVPDLSAMDRTAVIMWLIKHTRSRGYTKPRPNLTGLTMVIK